MKHHSTLALSQKIAQTGGISPIVGDYFQMCVNTPLELEVSILQQYMRFTQNKQSVCLC